MPQLDHLPKTVFIKELTLKNNHTSANLQDLSKQIKDALKLLKTSQSMKEKNPDTKEEDLHLANEHLIVYKGRRVCLDCLTVRPNL